MTHFFAAPDQVSDATVRITGTDLNHMKNVLRMKAGEQVSVSDGTSREYICRIDRYEEDAAILRIEDICEAASELPAKVVLFQGIPKGEKMDLIIQKSVELGVSCIVPTAMSRCVAKIEPQKAEKKLQRFRKISESAAKQSGRSVIPEILGPMSLKEAVSYCSDQGMRMIFAWEKAANPEESAKIFSGLKDCGKIALFIGPEGGFSDEEAKLLQGAGADTVTLGRRILRTETAPLFLLSVIGYELEMRGV